MRVAGIGTCVTVRASNAIRMETATTDTLSREKLMARVSTPGQTAKYTMVSGSWA
jgi:hypothetical protein